MAKNLQPPTLNIKYSPVVHLECYTCKASTPVREDFDLHLFTSTWITAHLTYHPDCAGGFRHIQYIEADLE